MPVSYRPLALVSGLTLGDYLLWNWSLNAGHDVLALISGLTLPPLALAFLATLVVTALRMIGGSARRSDRGAPLSGSSADPDQQAAESTSQGWSTTVAGSARTGSPAPSGSSRSPSGKLAA
jgi:hypothetical protein